MRTASPWICRTRHQGRGRERGSMGRISPRRPSARRNREGNRMPDFAQSTKGLDPPTVVDHVLLPVDDLDEGAWRLYQRFGLRSVAGGRHPKVGTANMIVPLGSQYLELIAIADPKEAEGSRLGRRLAHALKEGQTFVAWALRTQNLEGVAGKLQAAGWNLPPVIEGSRKR